ncbi:MAG: enoyl-CoA hydratase/isomerase family protein [Paracoccaceae bacterium]
MIETDIGGHVGTITLNRPESHNALDQAAMQALHERLQDWSSRDDIRVLVLTGAGKSFCAGASLGELAGKDWTENPLTTLCSALDAFPVPTICAMNGGAFGGGVELAMACDFRVGVEGMTAFVPPARLGIHYEPAGIARVVERLGSQAARRMFLLAETFDAAALKEIGFLDRLVAPQELDAEAMNIAGTIAGLAPLAVRGMKRTIREIGAGTLDTVAARKRIAACFASEDLQEGLAAMKEKRAPVFKGR